ncbi:hypothetical protein ACIRIR_35910 [Streptomyces globisporus]|uniref:hypothetical protein n=1 Tax=Streptomyces globisporus TaxID=1908 RepID=UPI0038179588
MSAAESAPAHLEPAPPAVDLTKEPAESATVVDIATGQPLPAPVAPDRAARIGSAALAALRPVGAVLPLRRALPDLVAGSWVLAGRGCACTARAVRWAWDQACADPEAAAQLAAHTKRAEAAAALPEGEERDKAIKALGAAPSGRRPLLEALAYGALGGMLAAGALTTLIAMLVPLLPDLGPWQSTLYIAGGLAWSIAAWAVAPALGSTDTPAAAPGGDAPEETSQEEREAARGTALLWHLITALSDAESTGRAGVHLDVVLYSAITAGLLPEDTELTALRSWTTAAGLPVTDKLGMRIEGRPVTRVGLRVDRATEALGMTPTALLEHRPGGAPATPAEEAGEGAAPAAPATHAGEPAGGPGERAGGGSAPAVLRLIPQGRQQPPADLSPTASPGAAPKGR